MRGKFKREKSIHTNKTKLNCYSFIVRNGEFDNEFDIVLQIEYPTFLPKCGKLPSTLVHVVIIPLLNCKSKVPADVNNYRPIAIATALSKYLSRSCCRDSP